MNAEIASNIEDMTDKWVRIGELDDIPRLGARVVRGPDGNIAVFRTADDAVFALLDRCPHRRGPLSQGIVHGTQVTCPLHDWKIKLQSGEAVAPDEGCTASFAVRVADDGVWLQLTPTTKV
jgi:nitrite reductase (NADH) small subunit